MPGLRGIHNIKTRLHYKLLFLYALTAVLLLGTTPSWGFRHLKEGEPTPDFQLKDIKGNTHSITKLKGNVTVILYWRVGQERSEKALKELKTLAETFADKPVKFLSITKDTNKKSKIKKLVDSLSLPFPVLLDEDEKVYTDFGVFVFPSTAIIDQNNSYQYHYGGFRDDYQNDLSGLIRLTLGLITKEELEKEKQQKPSELSETQRKAIRHLNLGKKLENKGLYDKAMEEFQKAVEADPANSDALVSLGLSLLEENKTDQALEHFKKAVELNPRSGDAKIGLGSAYHQKGDSEKALEVLKTGLLLCPESAQIHFEMGKVYQSLGNKDEAMNHYKESAECAIRLQKKRN